MQNNIILPKNSKLRYLSDIESGFKRIKKSKDFKYLDVHGDLIKDPNILERISQLVIPPAWEGVWISPFSNTHLQATGIDGKGRKQYIYHLDWKEFCQENKFKKLPSFGLLLPRIRKRVRSDMSFFGLDRRRVLATVVWLLENTFIRVGNEEYAKTNKSFGLTTLRNRHVKVLGSKVRFEFRGKSGVDHLVDVFHPKVAGTIKRCIELPGYQLFQCIDDSGKRHVIDSEDVNEYLQEITGEDVSAKDFRTWGGTLLSATTLHNLGEFKDSLALKQNLTACVKAVSSHLRNTPSVCRKYYIHPTVIKSYEDNRLISHFKKTSKSSKGLGLNEYRVLTLLEKYS